MKCENCRKRMQVISGNTDITVDGISVQVVNLPVFVCTACGKQFIHDIVIARAKNYIGQYGVQNNTVDFAACEQTEGEDAAVVLSAIL